MRIKRHRERRYAIRRVMTRVFPEPALAHQHGEELLRVFHDPHMGAFRRRHKGQPLTVVAPEEATRLGLLKEREEARCRSSPRARCA